MNRIALAVAISLLAGMAVGGLMTSARTSDEPAVVAAAGDTAGPGAFDERVERLEQIVAEEREARLALEDTLAMLYEELERIESGGSAAVRRSDQATAVSEARPARGRQVRNESEWMRDYQERRVGRLVDGGFSEDEARRVLRQESEAAFKAMQIEWEALRNGEAVDPFSRANNPQSILRESLGDDAYARYLEAQGQSTAINVTQVLSGSPGSDAGLQPGDQVVSYSGERVFNVMELRDLSMQGNPGEDVVIEVDRDGVRMQLTVPRGPIGITGSGARVRGLRGWGG
jgi:hypothetical protein